MEAGKWQRIKGIVIKGRGWTSGCAEDCPYPEGTVGLQMPHFQARGLDLSNFCPGTLNISIKPQKFIMQHPEFTLRNIKWHSGHPPEDFSFSRCWIHCKGQRAAGVVYYPHPETKVSYFLDNSTLEIIAEYIESIRCGDEVEIELNADEIVIG